MTKLSADQARKKALQALRSSGAKSLPVESVVLKAKNGSRWSGSKHNGDPWELTKSADDSFWVYC